MKNKGNDAKSEPIWNRMGQGKTIPYLGPNLTPNLLRGYT